MKPVEIDQELGMRGLRRTMPSERGWMVMLSDTTMVHATDEPSAVPHHQITAIELLSQALPSDDTIDRVDLALTLCSNTTEFMVAVAEVLRDSFEDPEGYQVMLGLARKWADYEATTL